MRTSNRKKLTGLLFTMAACLAILLPASDLPLCGQEKSKDEESKKKETPPPGGAVEVRFSDDSTVKVQVRDEQIELQTAYGKLLIPVADIQRIEFGLRIPDDIKKKIATALADLGSADFRRRQMASSDLLAFKEKAYQALLSAAKSGKDQETVRRVEDVLEKIREAVSSEVLEIPPHDVVHTADSKITGRINSDVLRVGTLAFGEQEVKLTDLRSLRAQNVREVEVAVEGALQDPGALRNFQNQVGKTITFKLMGPQPGFAMQMGVFGSDVYTMDSALEAAAVHAGVLQPGKVGVFRVTILGQQPGFQSSVRNGIASHAYGPWAGFRIEQPRGGQRKN